MKGYLNPEEAAQKLGTMTQEEIEKLIKETTNNAKLAKKVILELIEIDPRFSLLITAITLDYVKVISSGASPQTLGTCIFEALNFYAENFHDKEPKEEPLS